MKIAISGLPFSGKSTVFKALVGKNIQPKTTASGKVQLNIGTLTVEDGRLDNLAQILDSQKVTHPKLSLIDLTLSQDKSSKAMDTAHTKEFAALALVIGVFSSEDPVADLRNVESDLILSDLALVQGRIERIKKENKAKPKNQENPELKLLERSQVALEKEKVLKDLDLTGEELKILAGFQFFTLKPMLVIANLSEDQLKNKQYDKLKQKADEKNLKFLTLCAKLEAEIEELSEEERPAFMKEMGLESLARDKFIELCFESQDLISFFTVVGKEARAWPIRRGTSALQAAGCIHSDMERGFIRAEVINYKDFIDCASFAKAREKGLLRLESKEYPVQDGDIINFKFSV